MLRVATLATLFPDGERPNFGVFVERQTRALAARGGIELEVFSGVGLPPWPFSLHPRLRGRARLPEREEWDGLVVHRPRFRSRPQAGAGKALAKSLLPLVARL